MAWDRVSSFMRYCGSLWRRRWPGLNSLRYVSNGCVESWSICGFASFMEFGRCVYNGDLMVKLRVANNLSAISSLSGVDNGVFGIMDGGETNYSSNT